MPGGPGNILDLMAAVSETIVREYFDQIIRVLKNYEFFKEPQMELFRTGRKGRRQVKD